MNPQMMQYGNQIGGCKQPENYTHSGGGPPLPSGNYPPGNYPNMLPRPQQGAATALPHDYNQQKYPPSVMPGTGQPPPPNQNFQNGPMLPSGNINKPIDGMAQPPNMGFQKHDGAPQDAPPIGVGPCPPNAGVQLSHQMQAMNISGLPTIQGVRSPMGGPSPPTGLPVNPNQSQPISGPGGPQMPNMDGQFSNQQYGPQINGTMPSPSMGLPPNAQTDIYRQV